MVLNELFIVYFEFGVRFWRVWMDDGGSCETEVLRGSLEWAGGGNIWSLGEVSKEG